MDISKIIQDLEEPVARRPADDSDYKESSQQVPPLTRIERLLAFRGERSLTQTLRVIGDNYRFLMSREVWSPKHAINYIDALWLPLAQRMSQSEAAASDLATKLRASIQTRLSMQRFGADVLACTQRMRQFLPLAWSALRGLDTDQDPIALKLLRESTRYVGAVAYAHTYIVGRREIVMLQPQEEEVKALTADLEHLITNRAKTLPDQFHETIHQGVRVTHVPVDIATFYEAENPGHGMCDLGMALRSLTTTDNEALDMFTRWVPWPRPPKEKGTTRVGEKAVKHLEVAPLWLRELWYFVTFAFFFHSALAEATGQLGRSRNDGLFLERYFVSWWDLTRSVGAEKLDCQQRYHVKTLPILLQMARNQWWVRTDTQIVVCPSLAAALLYWFGAVGKLEDDVDVRTHCSSFLPSLAEPPASVDMSDASSPWSAD